MAVVIFNKMYRLARYYTIFICFIVPNRAAGQNLPDSSSRYVQAIHYMESNHQLIKKKRINLYAKKYQKTEKERLANGFSLVVSPLVCYMPILVFKDQIPNLDTITRHTNEEINNPRLYFNRFGYESFNSDFLTNIFRSQDTANDSGAKLYVNFSKPCNNYVLAEITTNKKRLDQCTLKMMGRTLWLLFVYSNEERLKEVYFGYLDH